MESLFIQMYKYQFTKMTGFVVHGQILKDISTK